MISRLVIALLALAGANCAQAQDIGEVAPVSGAPYYPTPIITPAGLSFHVVAAPTRNTDLFSTKFPIDPLNTFQSGSPATDYTEINSSGSPSYAYSGSGATISGATTGQGVLKSKILGSTIQAPYVFVETVINSAPTNATVSVGLADSTSSQYVLAASTGTALQLTFKVNGTSSGVGPTAYTPTYPYTLRLVLEYPEAQLWLTDSNGQRLMLSAAITNTGTDLRKQSKFQNEGWSAYFSGQSNSAAAWSATFQSFRSGYPGSIGLTNYKPVTYTNGQPYTANGKAYFWGTCSNGNGFKAGHGGIISVDLNTFAIQYVSLLFFNVSSSAPTSPTGPFDTTTSISVGQVTTDGTNANLWMSDWGYDDQTSAAGIQVYTASTSLTNLLTQNSVNILNSYELAMPSSATASYYDNTQYQDGSGAWHMAAAQTTSLSNWSGFAPSLLSGPAMSSLSLVTGPSGTLGEGPNWTQIGGTKYISTSGNASSTSPHWFDSGLNLLGGGLFPGTIDLTTYPPLSTSYYSHYPIAPIAYGSQTKYLLIYMDNSSVTSVLNGVTLNGARGAPVVEISQSVSGNEHF